MSLASSAGSPTPWSAEKLADPTHWSYTLAISVISIIIISSSSVIIIIIIIISSSSSSVIIIITDSSSSSSSSSSSRYYYYYYYSEKGEVLLRGSALYDIVWSLVTTLLVKCPSVQWQPDGLTIHANKWFLGAGFLGAPPISLSML